MPLFSNRSDGFTLIELLIVIVIIATAAVVAGPNISTGRSTAELKSGARDIASALRYVRGQALITHKDALFTINLENNSYRVSGRKKKFQIAKEIDITLVTAQSELTGDGQGRIRFFADGSSTGGRVTLEIGESKRIVDVNWLTGQIEINEE